MCESNVDEQDSPQFIDPRLEGLISVMAAAERETSPWISCLLAQLFNLYTRVTGISLDSF